MKAVRRYIGVTRPGSPASARIRHGRPYAPRAARRPPQRAAPPAERQFACRAATLAAARPDAPHGASRPGPANLPKFFHRPGAAPATDRNANPRSPPGIPGAASRGTRVRARAPGSALHAKPEWAARGPCPWPSVKKPTVRTDRPSGTDAVRYTSVDTAAHRPAVTHPDTRRDKKETARRTRFRSQRAVSAGGGRCWVRTNVG
jgi:hypothetical protein